MLLEGFSGPGGGEQGRILRADDVKETMWRPTKTLGIEWCPEREASLSDLDRAKNRQDHMWTTQSEEFGYSVFRDNR